MHQLEVNDSKIIEISCLFNIIQRENLRSDYLENIIYTKGLLKIPFANKITNDMITLDPIQIPDKTKISFLSIIHQNKDLT